MRTLIIGCGNPLRGDDGAGLAVAGRLAALDLPQVEVRCAPLLPVEWLPDLAGFDRIILIDAALGGDAVGLVPLRPAGAGAAGAPLGHQLPPPAWLALGERLYGARPEAWLCTVRGECFELGEMLSAPARARIDAAVAAVRTRLTPGAGRASSV
jgi:hydrogenase maturation protease